MVTSTDGVTWTLGTMPVISPWAITFGNNGFVAVGASGITTSQDGVTWTTPIVIADREFFGVTYGNGLYVAVGEYTNDRYGRSIIYTSSDAVNWTAVPRDQNDQATVRLNVVAYDANNGFVAVGSKFYYSADGYTWVTGNPATFYGIAHGYDSWVAGGWYNLYSSPDGSSWTAELPQDNAPVTDSPFHAVTFGNNSFVAVGGAGSGVLVGHIFIGPSH